MTGRKQVKVRYCGGAAQKELVTNTGHRKTHEQCELLIERRKIGYGEGSGGSRRDVRGCRAFRQGQRVKDVRGAHHRHRGRATVCRDRDSTRMSIFTLDTHGFGRDLAGWNVSIIRFQSDDIVGLGGGPRVFWSCCAWTVVPTASRMRLTAEISGVKRVIRRPLPDAG